MKQPQPGVGGIGQAFAEARLATARRSGLLAEPSAQVRLAYSLVFMPPLWCQSGFFLFPPNLPVAAPIYRGSNLLSMNKWIELTLDAT